MEASTVLKRKEEYKNHNLEVLNMKDKRKRYLIDNVIKPYFSDNDASKALLLDLGSLQEYKSLKQKLKKGKKQ